MRAIHIAKGEERNHELAAQGDLKSKAEILFHRAVDLVNRGMSFKSIQSAADALIYAKLSQTYLRVYIHSFLAMMYLENGKPGLARIHCWHSIHLLDKRDHAYHTDSRYLSALMTSIEQVRIEERKAS